MRGIRYSLSLAERTPYYRFLGFKIVEVKEGLCKIELPYREELTHPYGAFHGGAIASLLDSVSAMALLTTLDESKRIATCEIKVNFIRPAQGGSLLGIGKLIHKGKRTAVVEGEAYVRDLLVAKSLATLVYY